MATYNPAIPLNSDSPSIFPAQSQGNFTRLETLVGADHQFNLTAAANDGYHNLIHMTQQSPSGALASTGRLYVKVVSGQVNLFYMDDAGTEYQISPTLPIRASVNFNGTGAVGAQTLRSQYNVASVMKTGTGLYTINFTTPMPNNNYIVHLVGMRNTESQSHGYILGDATYGNSVSTTFVKVKFIGGTSSTDDVLMGNVTILSVS